MDHIMNNSLQELIDKGTFKGITHVESTSFPHEPKGITLVGVVSLNDTGKKIFMLCDQHGSGLAFHETETKDILYLLNKHFSE